MQLITLSGKQTFADLKHLLKKIFLITTYQYRVWSLHQRHTEKAIAFQLKDHRIQENLQEMYQSQYTKVSKTAHLYMSFIRMQYDIHLAR